MIIARFGISWPLAYVFPETQGSDDWAAGRPPVVTPVAGAGGAFDFFEEDGYPVSPLTIKKSFALTASTYSGIETALDEVRLRTIGRKWLSSDAGALSKLWGLPRTGVSEVVFTWAKCTSLKASETFGEQYLHKVVELTFYSPEGLWYSAEAETDYRVGPGTLNIDNEGNYPALVKTNVGSGMTDPSVTIGWSAGGSPVISSWTFSGSYSSPLVVDPATYSATDALGDVYANLTVGGGQVAWLYLPPNGPHRVTIGGSGSATVSLTWYHTYIM